MTSFTIGDLLYANPLAAAADVRDFVREGPATLTFPHGHLRLEGGAAVGENFLLWCPETFPADIAVSWDFRPLTDAGLAMCWFAATGRQGEDLFSPTLRPRAGHYPQYFDGDINAFHLSYYRRNPGEIEFRTCNLRKSHGFHLVCQGGDPLPDACYARDFYRIQVVKCGAHVQFAINDLSLLHWQDDGVTHGPLLGGGKFGFRQMAGLIADYANLTVHAVG